MDIVDLSTDVMSYSANFEVYQKELIKEYKAIVVKELNRRYESKEIEFEELLKGIKSLEDVKAEDDYRYPTANEIAQLVFNETERLEFHRFAPFTNYYRFINHSCYVVGARPAVGKTAFVLNLASDLARNPKYQIVYFNMEMNSSEMYKRLTGIEGGVPLGMLTNDEWQNRDGNMDKAYKAINDVANMKIQFVNGSKSINAIQSIIKKTIKTSGKHVVAIVDHIGYVKSDKRVNGEYENITNNMRELQLMTKDLDCTMIVLAHLRRAENGKSGDSSMDDLKGSGELEQSAHIVILLEQAEEEDMLLAKIVKNRDGRTGYVPLKYDKSTQRMDIAI